MLHNRFGCTKLESHLKNEIQTHASRTKIPQIAIQFGAIWANYWLIYIINGDWKFSGQDKEESQQGGKMAPRKKS